MSNLAISDDVVKLILEKWGVKLCSNMEINIYMEPNEAVKVSMSKYVTDTELEDVMNVLGDYYLVKRA